MNDVTFRFLKVYEYLKELKKVSGQSDFANKIGISSSMVTDIRKERSKPGLNAIRGIADFFTEINTHWLLTGHGEMSINANYPITSAKKDTADDPLSTYNTAHRSKVTNYNECKLCEEKERIIEQQRETINAMNLALSQLQNRLNDRLS